ncbi:MAG: hypothetical protein ACOCWI_01500 [Bacillota bacterium]
MSKKKEINKTIPQSYEELSDMEFIAYADYLSSPYYKNYLQAKQRSEMVEPKDIYAESILPGTGRLQKESGLTYRRRKGFLGLIAIFMVIILAVAVVGYFDVLPEYSSAFMVEDGSDVDHVDAADPVLGALVKFMDMDFDSVFYDSALAEIEDEENFGAIIAFYGMPIAIALALLIALIIFIAALAAMGKAAVSKGYVAKKTKFGFLSILLFVLTLFVTAAAIVWNGAGLNEIVEFFTGESSYVQAGYGLYALVGLSFLSLIFNLCAFKKVKD